MNAVEIAVPARSIMVKDEHFFVGERRNELNDEKRIATRLLVHQLWERRSDFSCTANSVRNQLPEMLSAERPKRDLLYSSAGGLYRGDLSDEVVGMSGWGGVTSWAG